MNLTSLLLTLVPGFPLILAIFRVRKPAFASLALLPAIVLLVTTRDTSVELRWLLFGSGFAIDTPVRIMLTGLVLLWAAVFTLSAIRRSTDERQMTFYLLTLAGHLGAILAVDLVGFFAFSTLMNYGFYALLVHALPDHALLLDDVPIRLDEQAVQRASKTYLVLLILADLLLFEALLTAVLNNEDQPFEVLPQAIIGSQSKDFYIALVLLGFTLKAGIWPLHGWVCRIYRFSPLPIQLLLGGVPLGVALLGFTRWLPLGQIQTYGLGLAMLGLGALAILYAITTAIMRPKLNYIPGLSAITATGLFAVGIGASLSEPQLWHRIGNLAAVFIALMGIGLAILAVIKNHQGEERQKLTSLPKPVENLRSSFERGFVAFRLWTRLQVHALFAWISAASLVGRNMLQSFRACYKWVDDLERYLQHWSLAVTLILMVAISAALLASI